MSSREHPAMVSGVEQDVAGAGNLSLLKVTDIWGYRASCNQCRWSAGRANGGKMVSVGGLQGGGALASLLLGGDIGVWGLLILKVLPPSSTCPSNAVNY